MTAHLGWWKCSSPSRDQRFVTLGTVTHPVPLSMKFSRQEYWSVLPCPSPGDLPRLWIKPGSFAMQADSLPSEPPGKPLGKNTQRIFLNMSIILEAHNVSLSHYVTTKLACVHAQSCPTLCNPIDCSLPGSSVHGIFQARMLEWVAISFSRGSSQPRGQNSVSCIS